MREFVFFFSSAFNIYSEKCIFVSHLRGMHGITDRISFQALFTRWRCWTYRHVCHNARRLYHPVDIFFCPCAHTLPFISCSALQYKAKQSKATATQLTFSFFSFLICALIFCSVWLRNFCNFIFFFTQQQSNSQHEFWKWVQYLLCVSFRWCAFYC